MRITLLGVLGFLAVAALLVYVGYELHRVSAEKEQSQAKPYPSEVNP